MRSIIVITVSYAGILLTSWKVQEYDQLLGYTIGVVGIFTATLLWVDYIARGMK
jgi:hypothetical protein